MSVASKTIAAPAPGRITLFWASSIGKKALMALTGIVLFLYVLGHLLGNLQLYLGPDSTGAQAIDRYARFLHESKGLLWTARTVIGLSFLVHAVAGIQLHLAKAAARPVPYHQKESVNSTVASRTMIWTGVLILGFVVYHLLHLTVGSAHPDFREGQVFHNVTVGLARGGAALAYVVAMVALGFHLRHGLYSLFQSLGAGNPAITRNVYVVAAWVGTAIALANLSFPLAALVGFGRG
ncbi:MAG TPA: succinate dehydrogenase cytochrome b subunit [Anaeromyxobacteraceae bacterium]|jgi:succinate dehydrogenase / fumarate reductase cytochrome b subunit